MLFTEKFRPRRLAELAGNGETVEKIRRWALAWEQSKAQQPLLLHGAIGTGKTCAAHALAAEFGWELLEMNASGLRNEEAIERVAGAAGSSLSLSGKRKLILLDDVDGLQGKEDKGGAGAIARLLEESKQPVILTAHDIWDKKLGAIRNACAKLEFKKINASSVAGVLRKVAREEKLNVDDGLIAKISSSCGGDLRSALNDLQGFNNGAERDRERNIFDTVRTIFKAASYADARKASFESGEDRDTLKLWIDENIPNEYEFREEIAASFDMLSRADIFDGRIYRRQYWGLLRYSGDLMSAGVALSRSKTGAKFTTYSFPSYLRSMGATKGARAMRKKIGAKLGKLLHCSSRDAADYFELVADECTKDIIAVKSLYGLEDEELAFLLGKTEKEIGQMAEIHERRRDAKEEKEDERGEKKLKASKGKNEKNPAGEGKKALEKNPEGEKNPKEEKAAAGKHSGDGKNSSGEGKTAKEEKTAKGENGTSGNGKPLACKLSDFC